MNYTVISSGSKGNCVVIGKVMVDIGVAFKHIKEHLYSIDAILLTHIHSDHIKESTLKNICVLFPHIKIYGNYEVAQIFDEYPITVVNEDVPFIHVFDIGNGYGYSVEITPFKCLHDVLTYGYTWSWVGNDIIYATDTQDLRYAPVKKYDYFFIESNHDEKKVEQIVDNHRSYGYDAYAGAKRHQSVQKAKAFYYMNRKDKDSVLIELHKSNRFY